MYQEWGERKGVVGVQVVKGKQIEGGSVRSGSVLTHYPGGYFLHKCVNYILFACFDLFMKHFLFCRTHGWESSGESITV